MMLSSDRLERRAESLACCAAGHDEADHRTTVGDTAGGKRPGLARSVSRHRRRNPRGTCHHARGRVAGRQLSCRQQTDSRNPRRPPARLLPSTAETCRRATRSMLNSSARIGSSTSAAKAADGAFRARRNTRFTLVSQFRKRANGRAQDGSLVVSSTPWHTALSRTARQTWLCWCESALKNAILKVSACN